MNKQVKLIIEAAEAGGKIVKKYFGADLKLQEKTMPSDFTTKADIESEKAILKIITKHFLNYNIYSEEIGGINKNSEYQFIIDPLDGSNNFVLGIADFTVTIALTKGNESLISVTHHPIQNKTFYSVQHKGSFLNNKRLQVNKESNINRATVVYTCDYKTPRKRRIKITKALENLGIKRLLNNWSPAWDYCLLASGKIEAIINDGNEVYDCVAGKPITREAGALLTDYKGKEDLNDKNTFFIASNGTKIHKKLLDILTK